MAVGFGPHEQHIPALEGVLSCQGLEKKDLERRCSARVRLEIANLFDDWKMVGYCLGFTSQNLKDIEVDNSTEELRRVALLDTWEQRHKIGATYLKLAEALHRRKRIDLVERLCEIIKTDSGTEVLVDVVYSGKYSIVDYIMLYSR